MIGAFAMLQAVASSPEAATASPCNRGANGEVVVCGTHPGVSPYRLPKLADKYQRKPLRAETDAIPGVHTQAHVQSEKRSDGYVANRIMLTLSTPF